MIEGELLTGLDNEPSNIREILEMEMLERPEYWENYYGGNNHQRHLARKFSFSDRIRYYWPAQSAQISLAKLIQNLRDVGLPLSLVSQFFPIQYERIRRNQIENDPIRLILDHIQRVYERYSFACGGSELSEENISPANLPDMNKLELELKANLEAHVGPTVEADDALYDAKEKLKRARTRAARRTAQDGVDAAQAKYDEERETHKQLQTGYNDAKAKAAEEEEITLFSLGERDLPTIRDLTGEIASKDVTVRTQGPAGTKDYKFFLRKYSLKDENMNLHYRGRWIITVIEPLD